MGAELQIEHGAHAARERDDVGVLDMPPVLAQMDRDAVGARADIVRLATRLTPAPFQATLVPEKRQEITTEGGLALRKGDRRLSGAIARLKDAGIRVSLFIDPSVKTIDVARQLGVPAIELHTGKYANASKR